MRPSLILPWVTALSLLNPQFFKVSAWSSQQPRRPFGGSPMVMMHCRGGAAVTHQDSKDDSWNTSCQIEVVGAGGRMGSLFLQCPGAAAVPRGVSPGVWTTEGRPIVVATPSQAWNEIYRQTPCNRKSDLVWIGNGLPPEHFSNATVVVSHYGVLSVGARTTTTTESPETYVYGKHAAEIQTILEERGVRTKHVSSWQQLRLLAARKLLWASSMWLLCHSSDPPLTLSEVHSQESALLNELLEELVPALQMLTGDASTTTLRDTLAYFQQYSLSMPDAVPRKDLAIDEVRDRNGIWLALTDHAHPKRLHEELLRSVAGEHVLNHARELSPNQVEGSKERVDIAELNIALWGEEVANRKACKSAIVIGGGIIGSSIALNLARAGVAVTVLDRLPDSELGATTPASWAWINANQKHPLDYQVLNQLGMLGWRRSKLLGELPLWNGALVQLKNEPNFTGGYAVEGPLSPERMLELEPQANFSTDDGPVYFFPDEGCVDPSLAVRQLRREAREIGVTFVGRSNVTSLVRNDQGAVVGASFRKANVTSESVLGDVVVVAAGIGSALRELGGLPLCHNTGQIAYAVPRPDVPALSRILVDTLRESHVLMRHDGTIVAGGGYLQVGGSSSSQSLGNADLCATDQGPELLRQAGCLAPDTVGTATYTHFAQAPRPIPRDGRPAIGYLEDALYVAVTHSGVTLAPIVAPCVATELSRGVSLDLLKPYRPQRLFPSDHAVS